MKKIFILIFTLISFNCFAVEKSTTFTKETFNKAQSEGKTVVVKFMELNIVHTCAKNKLKVLDQAENEFDRIF